MSRFKSLKEVSLKKKIFVCLIILSIIVAVVFLVIRFGFPDADVTKPHALAYEVGADSTSEGQFKSAFDFFDANCEHSQKNDSRALRDLNSFYLARLSVNKTTNHNVDRLLLSLSEVKDLNKLNKKIKKLESLKKDVDSSKSEVVAYCENQVMPYKEGTTDYSRISDYFSNFAKKFTNYLKSMREFENYLAEIIQTSTEESSYSNYLTKFTTSLNNKRLSACVDRCQKKFVDGEDVSIGAPLFDLSKDAKTTIFEQKENAIETFVSNRNLTIQNIDTINSMDWFDGWLEVFGTDKEIEFLKSIDSNKYNQFKSFMTSLYTTTFTELEASEVKA